MRELGSGLCFTVTPRGQNTPIGIFQIRDFETDGGSAEWGFAIGSEYWGTGMFVAAAALVMGFAFETVGLHRLEARAAVRNGRGNGALRKIGATPEGVLRSSFLRNGEYLDQVLWSIVEEDFMRSLPAERQYALAVSGHVN